MNKPTLDKRFDDENLELNRVYFQSAMYELYFEIQSFAGFLPSSVTQKYHRLRSRFDDLLTALDDYIANIEDSQHLQTFENEET